MGHVDPPPLGNARAVTHGATAVLKLAPKAEAIAEELRSIVPVPSDADEITLRLLSLTLARIEAAEAWLDANSIFRTKAGAPQPILADLNRWVNTAAKLAGTLGLSTTARAALNLQRARTYSVGEGLEIGRQIAARRQRLELEGCAIEGTDDDEAEGPPTLDELEA